MKIPPTYLFNSSIYPDFFAEFLQNYTFFKCTSTHFTMCHDSIEVCETSSAAIRYRRCSQK